MDEFDIENFPTNKTAKEMLHMVSEDFYATSYVGKWLFEVMGIEWDEIKDKLDELPDQFFIETATWGLRWHEIRWQLPVREELSYEERRQILYAKRDFVAPMTPHMMEKYIKSVVGVDAQVMDVHDHDDRWSPEHPNTFCVVYHGGSATLDDMKKCIDSLKQSQTTYIIYATYNTWDDYSDRTWDDVSTLTWQQMRENE